MTETGIYHWKLGDIALARICKKVYARVRVVKNEKGLFYDDMGVSSDNDDSITVSEQLCYFVETCRSQQRLWLPYTCMHLAERSRPFYGPADKIAPSTKSDADKENLVPRKRKIKEDHTLPLSVKLINLKDPDLNTTFDIRHTPLKQSKYNNAFSEFVRRGKEMLFDQLYIQLQQDSLANADSLDYLQNIDASTEDKFEMAIKGYVTEKEIENYLHQCWRYNFIHKQPLETKEGSDGSQTASIVQAPIAPHINWCLVCGKRERLRGCPACPAAFHLACRREWLVSVLHRKNPPKKASKPSTVIKKILSSTRTICSIHKEKENQELCPSCMWGPKVGYDDVVWHKLGSCGWWPARVLAPGAAPPCLLARRHLATHYPLRYYGTLNHSWGEAERMCLFLPSHVSAAPRDPRSARLSWTQQTTTSPSTSRRTSRVRARQPHVAASVFDPGWNNVFLLLLKLAKPSFSSHWNRRQSK